MIKKIITIFAPIILFVAIPVEAQYFNIVESWTAEAGGETYRYDKTDGGIIILYNANGRRLFYAPWEHRDGTPIPVGVQQGEIETMRSPTRAIDMRAAELVDEAFSEEEFYNIAAGAEFISIDLFIDPDTGGVMEVSFEFSSRSPLMLLPVDVFHRMETALKENIRYTMTAAGRKLNYGIHGWEHRVGDFSYPRYVPDE